MKLELMNVSVLDTARGVKRGVSQSHAIAQQIKDISLSLYDGDKVYVNSILGAERAVTFMRVLMKVINPTSGGISIKGRIFPFIVPSAGIRNRADVNDNLILRGLQAGFSMYDAKEYSEKILARDELSEYRLCAFSSLPRDIQLLILCRSLEVLEPQILVLEGWMVPTGDPIKKIAHTILINLIKKANIAVVSVNRTELMKSLCNYEMTFGDEQGVELIEI